MASAWTEHRSPTGRLYWYNSVTSTSSWERPDELKTPAERALASTPWKEYQTAEGRKYWHHTQTKETTWSLPDEIRETIEKAAAAAPAPAPAPVQPPSSSPMISAPNSASANQKPAPMHPTFVPASKTPLLTPGQSPMPPTGQSTPSRPPLGTPPVPATAAGPFTPPTAGLPARPLTSILHSAPAPNPVPVTMPEFKSPEDAERAFIGLLRVKGVNPSWTWEQTMRDIITEPLYKALDTLAARKAAWEKFIENERKREKENREKNIARVRSSWNAGLDSLSTEKTITNEEGVEVKLPPAPPRLWWTWERLKSELEKRAPDVWKLCRDDEERKVLWEDYLSELRQRDIAAANQLRSRQQEKLTNLLRSHDEKLNLPGPLETIQWRVAQEAILQSEEFQQDEDLRKMEDLDILIVFEDEIKRAEKESAELKAKQKDEKRRQCRKTRAAYIQLLHELKLAGEIRAGTMWKDFFPLIEEEERYLNLLGLPGSSPLDLFWDIVDDLDQEVEENQRVVEDVLYDLQKTVTEATELEEFLTWVKPDSEPHKLDRQSLKQVFVSLHDRAVRIAKDEKRRAEKRLRNQIEDLRYSLKKISPPIEINTSYEDALPRFSDLPEFKALEGQEEGRKEAYNRYMDRLKEKAAIEDKKSRRRDDDPPPRSDSKKKGHSQLSDDDGSVISSSKRRKRDFNDDDGHRNHSPRNSRLEEISSPRARGSYREDKDHDNHRDSERSKLKERESDRKNDRSNVSERGHEDETERGSERNQISQDKPHHDEEKPKSKDRDRSREAERDKSRARDHRDRAKERERSNSRTRGDDRDRRRREYDADRHGSRHHRSSRRDKESDERDGERPRYQSRQHEEENRSSKDKKASNPSKDDREGSEKRSDSRDPTESKTRNVSKEGALEE